MVASNFGQFLLAQAEIEEAFRLAEAFFSKGLPRQAIYVVDKVCKEHGIAEADKNNFYTLQRKLVVKEGDSLANYLISRELGEEVSQGYYYDHGND